MRVLFDFFINIARWACVKVLFLNSMVETKTKPIQIARRLGIAKQEVTRILNPRQKTKIDTLEKAIEATGKKLIYSIV